ncbi:MAG TPA: hypothetical protein VMB52_01005 [Verrucomicrobiae bacterium]|nr:hypothetical protein [Verrucomicrobiae bacterium]
MNTNTINYQPLDAEQHVFWKVVNRCRVPSIAVLIIAAVLGFILPPLALGVVFLGLIAISIRTVAFKNEVWDTFAAVNGWSINVVVIHMWL